jgi:hypothetical protein
MLLLTDLLPLEPLPGRTAGRCFVCGRLTEQGHAEAPSDTFLAWSEIGDGTVHCERCWAVMKDRRYRTQSWVATRAGVEFHPGAAGRSAMRTAILAPPEPPFVVHLTRRGQKQSWLSIVHHVNLSRQFFWVGTDWAGAVLLSCDWVTEHLPLLERLRERKVSKTQLQSGVLSPGIWLRAIAEGWVEDAKLAERLAGDRRWEVLIQVAE